MCPAKDQILQVLYRTTGHVLIHVSGLVRLNSPTDGQLVRFCPVLSGFVRFCPVVRLAFFFLKKTPNILPMLHCIFIVKQFVPASLKCFL